jgi:hypothetical protein
MARSGREPGEPAPEGEQRRLLAVAFGRAELTLEQLWQRYFALGGDAGLAEVEAHLHGRVPLPAAQSDVLAHALNERLDELVRQRRVPYRRVVHAGRPATGPLAALVELLIGTRLAPPEQLSAVVAAAGRAIGSRMGVYLVDYDQDVLVPVPGPNAEGREPLRVDASLAGQAFRRVRALPSEGPGEPRLWVPLLDGVERIGVLEVVLGDRADLYDPGLREQCRWLAALIGHLVVAATDYGDALDLVRRTRPRTATAEMIWQLLPPLTAGTDRFTLAGLLEPTAAVGGDAFDYALGETTAHMAIFDATGHSLFSGLIAAAALAAYRSARRNGDGLYRQAVAIDDAVAELFSGSVRFVTGVLAELDLPSGRLRYITGGHPAPLLMRHGKVVKALDGGHRPLFGVSAALDTALEDFRVGEEMLQPGDWLIFYTDGVVEARDSTGEFFGEPRLIDFVQRAAASGQPPPETVRRLVKAVMAHQNGVLQDDATVVLAHWGADDTPTVVGPPIGGGVTVTGRGHRS